MKSNASSIGPIRAIIFDCDGTLVDSETISLKVLTELVVSFGYPLKYERAVERFSGQDLKLVFAEIESEMSQPLPADIIEQFRKLQIPRLESELREIAGASLLLQSVQVPYCIASNAPQSKIRVCLQTTGLMSLFADDRIFSAYDVDRWKPDPTLFLMAAEKLGVAPQECAVVEDSVFGIDASLSAGMQTFVYDPHRQHLSDDRVRRVDTLPDLIPMFTAKT